MLSVFIAVNDNSWKYENRGLNSLSIIEMYPHHCRPQFLRSSQKSTFLPAHTQAKLFNQNFLGQYCEGCDWFSKAFYRSQSMYFLWLTGNYFLAPWLGLPLSLSLAKCWGNPIKSRAPPVSNTGGIKMSRARYRHPHRIMLPHNFNQRIRKSKNGSVIFEFDSANTGEKEKFWD